MWGVRLGLLHNLGSTWMYMICLTFRVHARDILEENFLPVWALFHKQMCISPSNWSIRIIMWWGSSLGSLLVSYLPNFEGFLCVIS